MSTVQRAEPKLCEVVCPVEVIGRQLNRMIRLMHSVQHRGGALSLAGDDAGAERCARHDRALYSSIVALQSAASHLRATSAYGAVLHLGLISDVVATLAGLDDDEQARREALAAEADRMMFSVAGFLERSFTLERDDYALEYFVSRHRDYLAPDAPIGGYPGDLPADDAPAD